MASGELACLCGVSTDTQQHYEKIGVLARPARTAAGYRRYPLDAEARVRLVRRAGRCGRDQIQMHLSHIAHMFAGGDFQAPLLIHDRVPTLQRLKNEIKWTFEKTQGGRVRAVTSNAEARDALYQFLRFQIADHQTGDPDSVSPAPT